MPAAASPSSPGNGRTTNASRSGPPRGSAETGGERTKVCYGESVHLPQAQRGLLSERAAREALTSWLHLLTE